MEKEIIKEEEKDHMLDINHTDKTITNLNVSNSLKEIPDDLKLFLKTDIEREYLFFNNLSRNIQINEIAYRPLLKLRNPSIILSGFIMLSAIIGGLTFFIRKTAIYVILNLIFASLSILGFYASINVSEILMILFTTFDLGVSIVMLFFQIFHYSKFPTWGYKNDEGELRLLTKDYLMLILISLPYIFDVIVGIVFCVLLGRLYTTYNYINEKNKRIKIEYLKKQDFYTNDFKRRTIDIKNIPVKEYDDGDRLNEVWKNIDKDVCLICFNNPRNMIFEPCNHICICSECFKENEIYLTNYAHCVRCRKDIQSASPIFK